MAQTCRVSLLGGFRVEVDGRPVPADAWRHRRGADLVKLLALAPGHRLHRERIVDALWPDLDAQAGTANLRKALHYARRAAGGLDCIRIEGPMVVLWPHGLLEVDVDRFEAEEGVAAVELYGGDLLPEDLYEPWTEEPRERLRRRYLAALKAAGRWTDVAELDPLDEEACRALMRTRLEAGDRMGAMRQFERLREVLREELGVAPDAATVAVYDEALALEGREPPSAEELARSHLAAGLVALNRMDLDEAEREAAEARALAVDSGLGKELGEASGLLGMVAHARGTWRDVFRREFEAAVGDPSWAEPVLDAHLCLAEYSLYAPEGPEPAAEFARELLGLARREGSAQGEAVARLMLGESALLAGRLDEAGRELEQAAALAAGSGRPLATVRRAELALARGRGSEARRLLGEARGPAETSALASHLVVRVLGAEVQARDPALEVVLEAEEELAGRTICEPCSIGFLTAAAIASARAGDRERAGRYLGEAERVSGMWQGGAWAAAVWEARAEVRRAEGDAVRAAALFQEAADAFAEAGHPLAAERCRAAAGNGSGTAGS